MSKSGKCLSPVILTLVRSYMISEPEIKNRKELRLMNYGEKEWIRKRS